MNLVKNFCHILISKIFKTKQLLSSNLISISLGFLIIFSLIFSTFSVNGFSQENENYSPTKMTKEMWVLEKLDNSDVEDKEKDLINIIEQQIRFIKELRKIYGKDSLFRMAIILFMTIGPIKIIPVFVKITQKSDAKIRIKLAIRGFALSTTAIVAVALSSQNILNKYNISLSALLATAGLILSLISIKMLLAQYETTENHQTSTPENPLNSLISPLTFPTILTPQGIAFVMISMTIAHRLDNNVHKLLGLIIAVMILNLMAMLYAREILNFLKPTLLQVFSLTLNIIQLALGISFIFSAINLQFLTIYYILNTSF
ncbi:MAG: MarC family protein [Crocosphaera sp.]